MITFFSYILRFSIVKRMMVIIPLNRNLSLRYFWLEFYLSFFLYISIVKVQWPPGNSEYDCKNHIQFGKKPVNNFASEGRLIYYYV